MLHHTPVVSAQDEQRDSAPSQILLVTDFLIGGDEQIEAGLLCRRQQRTILESRPALELCRNHNVPAVDEKPELLGHALVQNNPHAARDGSAGGTALLATKSRTACTCSLVT